MVTDRRIVVSGASGFVGSRLVPSLVERGYRVERLVRSEARAKDEIRWDPAGGALDASRLEGMYGAVHLAGASVAGGRWSARRRAEILGSRVDSTRTLVAALTGLARPPRVLVSASAIGFYGDRGDEELDESSAAGRGFLADVCRAWEAATQPAREAGVRVVCLRIGLVLGPGGGALARMVLPFRLGLGGALGDGRQWVSWISLTDVVRAIEHALDNDALEGPVNAVAPEPARNAELTRALARAVRRPAFLAVPAAAIRLALGPMGQELFLASTRVLPRALERSGFAFREAALSEALESALG